MKFACMTCAAKYSVPDGRLEAAGAAGLRIRCSRCRAIMVVSEATALEVTPSNPGLFARSTSHDEDDTRKDLPLRRRQPATISTDSLAAAGAGAAGGASSSSAGQGAPAALSASGVFRPLPGVHRSVTGLFFPELEELKADGKSVSSRVWYAAVDGRPRGPFSASEMVSLAEKGKIRESTLVWRPGFSTWRQVRTEALERGSVEDLGWLRKTVKARKLRESEAQRRAEQVHGIKPVSLTRTSAGKRPHAWQPGFGNPPPLPPDDDDDIGDLDAIVPLSQTSGFHWRADHPARGAGAGATGVRRRQSLMLWALAFVALVVVVAAGTSLALKTQAMERIVSALLP